MAASRIQLGQVWRSDATGDDWLVTKVYSELFTSYAVLRKTAGAEADVRRLKVERASDGVALPGFTLIQEADTC
ncbi:MAG TPA: hypothetical protein VGW33_01770 [Terriglobia bacterium]|nr:hypothetical protein [Terriglobia bacterium]